VLLYAISPLKELVVYSDQMPRIARIASSIALVLTAFSVISAFSGQLVGLVYALIPFMAGIGILRKRAWDAYGFALVLLSELALLAVIYLRLANRDSARWDVFIGVALILILTPLFVFAGRSLAATDAPRGSPWPWVVLAVLFVFPFLFFQAFSITTGAMEDTLLAGDGIAVQVFPKPRVSRDALIVFRYPVDRNETFVKRVIGEPGDRIRIEHKVVFRNGVALSEPYANHKTDYEDSYRDNFPGEPNSLLDAAGVDMLTHHVVNGEVVVPQGEYFVLGDNRDNSLDSRYWGFIESSDLIGKPVFIYRSEDRVASQDIDISNPPKTRWSRIFKRL
jgi:signal peptidase I